MLGKEKKQEKDPYKNISEAFLEVLLGEDTKNDKITFSDVCITCSGCGNYHSIWIPCPEGDKQNGINLYDT